MTVLLALVMHGLIIPQEGGRLAGFLIGPGVVLYLLTIAAGKTQETPEKKFVDTIFSSGVQYARCQRDLRNAAVYNQDRCEETMTEIKFNGRGGQGAVIAAQILAKVF